MHISAILFPEKKELWSKLPRSIGILNCSEKQTGPQGRKRGWLACGGDSRIVLLVLFQAGLRPQQRIKKPGSICTSLFCLSLCGRYHCVRNARQGWVRPRTSLAGCHSPRTKEALATLPRRGDKTPLQSQPQPLRLVPTHGPVTTAAATGTVEKSCPSINYLAFATQ